MPLDYRSMQAIAVSGLLLAERDFIRGFATMRSGGLVSLVNFVGRMEVANQCVQTVSSFDT